MRNLRRIVGTFLFSALLTAGAVAQGPQSQQTAQQFNVQPLDTAPSVTGAQALSDFENGSTVRFYFIITHLNAVISAPTQTADRLGPASLSSSNGHRITITWNSINGATFDVLEASTPVLPVASNCACAVATGLTANNVLDVGSYSSYSTAFTFGLNWNVSQSINSGIPTLNFFYNGVGCSLNALGATSCSSSGGAVSSVGFDYTGPEFSIANSPITSSGIMVQSKTVQAPNTVWAGPAQNSVNGVFDNSSNTITNSVTAVSTSLTPNYNRDLEIFVTENDHNIGQGSAPVITGGPGSWTTIASDGNNGIFATQLLTTATPITATSTMVTTTNVGQCLVGLQVQPAATPVLSNLHSVTGAVTPGATLSYTPASAGDSVLIVLMGAPSNSNSVLSYLMTDTQNTIYTPVCNAQNFSGSNGTITYMFLASNVTTNARTIKLNTLGGPGFSGSFIAVEISQLQPSTGTSGFRPLVTADMPIGVQNLVNTPTPSIVQFNGTTQSGNVNVTASNTSIMSLNVTFPSTGCPCRVFYAYSLYPDYAGVTNEQAQEIWVDDGSIQYGNLQTGQSNASTGAKTSMANSGFSFTTYPNSTSTTFTLVGRQDTGSTFLLDAAPLFGPGGNAYFEIVIYTSN